MVTETVQKPFRSSNSRKGDSGSTSSSHLCPQPSNNDQRECLPPIYDLILSKEPTIGPNVYVDCILQLHLKFVKSEPSNYTWSSGDFVYSITEHYPSVETGLKALVTKQIFLTQPCVKHLVRSTTIYVPPIVIGTLAIDRFLTNMKNVSYAMEIRKLVAEVEEKVKQSKMWQERQTPTQTNDTYSRDIENLEELVNTVKKLDKLALMGTRTTGWGLIGVGSVTQLVRNFPTVAALIPEVAAISTSIGGGVAVLGTHIYERLTAKSKEKLKLSLDLLFRKLWLSDPDLLKEHRQDIKKSIV